MNTFPEKSKMNFDAIIREKILDVETLKRMMAVWRMKSKTIVFTNGCFDLLHPGHLHVLHAARSSGDVLIVGLNTDSSVNKLKPGRPLQDELSRATLLASLEVVDAVILFDEETPEKLIGNILPDVIVKGGDYTPDQVAGKKIVEDHGGTVEIVPLLKNFSTTRLVQKIRSQQ